MTGLAELAESARRSGWAVGSMSLHRLRWQAQDLGWEEVPTRTGDSAVSVLRPTSPEEAHPRSLSATHGLGEQPLHTDGAHLTVPPQFVVLHTARPNGTPTLVWSLYSPLTNPDYPEVPLLPGLRAGVFVVHSGKERFLTTARDTGGFRYDPGCMTPCDQRARDAVRYFESLASKSHRHDWTEPDQVLVIDNRRALHARGAVSAADVDRELSRVVYHVGGKR
jgi:alpha-ketoglutarate-dependent taurine dioxygenase